MIRDDYQDPYDIPFGPGVDEPVTTAAASTQPSLQYNFIGIDPNGKDVYQGSDGQMYTGDPNGMNGFGPYSGPGPSKAGTTDPVDPGPPPGGGGGGGTAPPTGGTLIDPYTGTFNAPPMGAYPDLPGFTPPTYTPPPAFAAPTSAEVLNDDGYQFAASEGERNLQQSAAARGVLNTGGTLKDILAWGGNYAQQRYGDVYDRKKDIYNTNYQTQFRDPYEYAYKGALDAYAPKLAGWQTGMQATQRDNENTWSHAYDLFNFDFNKWRDQRDSTWNKKLTFDTL